jgi:hypothetical protein
MSEFIIKPFNIQYKDNLKIETSICPICNNKNYFIFNIKTGKWEEEYSRCEHYVRAEIQKNIKVAVYRK